MNTFSDIPQFPTSYYTVNVDLQDLQAALDRWNEGRPQGNYLILNPEWQRGHVWTRAQQISFMEYFLKGGGFGRNLYFNCSSWMDNFNTPIYCLDGLQRITAALAFMNGEIPVFGKKLSEWGGSLRTVRNNFILNMFKLKSKKELLKVYLDFNSGGTPHDPKEIKRIQEMMERTKDTEIL